MTFPTIEKDGSFGECELVKPLPNYRRAILPPVDFTTGERSMYATCAYETYRLEHFGYQPDNNRVAKLSIYVSDEYLKDFPNLKPSAKRNAINAHVDQNSAWLFTYATREKR